MSGTAKVGRTLTAKVPSGSRAITWNQANVKSSYQWVVGGQVRSTRLKYKLQPRDAGLKAVFAVVGTKAGFQAGSAKASARTVAKLASSTRLTVSRMHAGKRGRATISVTVAGLRPTGTVKLWWRGKVISSGELRTTDRGTVRLVVPAFAKRVLSLKATYSGSSHAKGSTSRTLRVKVT